MPWKGGRKVSRFRYENSLEELKRREEELDWAPISSAVSVRSPTGTETEALDHVITGEITQILRETLSPRQLMVVERHLSLGHTFQEIADTERVNRQRIAQIYNAALEKLRKSEHASKLRDFL